MKKLPLSALFVLACVVSYGQNDSTIRYPDIGITGSAGASLYIGSIPDDLESVPAPALSLGVVTILHTLDEDFSLMVGLTYDIRNFQFQNSFGEEQTISLSYLSVQAGFKYKSFFLTPTVGIAINQDQFIEPDPFFYTTEQSPDPFFIRSESIDIADIIVELRGGALVPIGWSGKKHIDVIAQASVSLFGKDDGLNVISTLPESRTVNHSLLLSALIGISYFFSL